MVIGSTVTGKLLDWDFQRIRKNLLEISEKDGQLFRDDQFPIEKVRTFVTRDLYVLMLVQARLRLMPFLAVIYTFSTIGYGWCIEQKVNIAGPLVLLIGGKSFLVQYPATALRLILSWMCFDFRDEHCSNHSDRLGTWPKFVDSCLCLYTLPSPLACRSTTHRTILFGDLWGQLWLLS